MNNTSNVSFRIDTDIKKQADRLFSALGLNMTTAFNIFLRQSIREGSIPFNITVKTPNTETVAAFEEAEQLLKDPNTKRYTDMEEIIRELNS
ncbi:MAG: type II toxin-antitoxin system RelB/DinJ family antitoxin [Alphaproteobacteria bacterium]|nr:type II toxin-antitoxin system RelB/DinJ family antitoxin [Alphaproteobacteria bacterium]MCL2505472.1 type II toxin-antitoxin system RelB/DinJ family antitoxin [Alphaproteobacteria bacterium]